MLAVIPVGTDPESIFVASACEYGVAVQGDGSEFRNCRLNHHSLYSARGYFESFNDYITQTNRMASFPHNYLV